MAEKDIRITKPVSLLPFPYRIDIIIPFYGQYQAVTRLVESIFRFTMSNVYTIFLVDDCSPNHAFLDSLKDVPNLVTLRTERQLGFGGALGVGFAASQEADAQRHAENRPRHPFVVLMQSDCEVRDVNWLRSLGTALLAGKPQNVRMVGPRTDRPMGGDPRQEGQPGDLAETVVLADTSLSLYCALCHRDLFYHIGGFVRPYPYGYFEDEELGHRMRHHGFRQAIVGNAWIHHQGQATIRPLWRDRPESRKVMLEENRDRCIADMKALRAGPRR